MKDAQKPDHISLDSIVNRLKDGRYVIPDFQREFEWRPWDVNDLMRSIFLDYYIGSLLLWKGKKENFDALACESIYGYAGGADRKEYIVLDGQQRLTAMYYAFVAPDKPMPKRRNRYIYYISVDLFMDEEHDKAFGYDWTRWGHNLLEDEQAQFEQHIFPLKVIGKGGWELANWSQGYENFWKQKQEECKKNGDDNGAKEAGRHAENAKEFGTHLREITSQYQIAFIELDCDLAIDKICDIFTKVNSKGIQLDIFDLINALLKPKGLQLKHMWRKASPRLEFVEANRMNVYVLQVMSILRQGYCSPKYLYYLLPGQERPIRNPDGTHRTEILVHDKDDFEKRWNGAVEALVKAVDVLRHPQEFGAISSKYLPYASILPAFAALQTKIKKLPHAHQLEAQKKIRQWYWSSVFLSRYSGAVESTTTRDYLDVKDWFNGDGVEPKLIDEFRNRFSEIDLQNEQRGGSSIYNGIFNLLVIEGARDWVTGNVSQPDDLDDHHIVPKARAQDNGLKLGGLVDSILNRTPLTSDTNRNVIGDKLPNEYLPALISKSGKDTVRSILESHFISADALDILLRDPFEKNDFEEFLKERERTIRDTMGKLGT